MGWKRRWPERPSRPKMQQLSTARRDQILQALSHGVAASPVLSSLDIRVRTLRGRFYFERVWHDDNNYTETEVIGRITPLSSPKNSLLLEVEKSKGNWFEVTRGAAKKLVGIIADDTKGTFHGLGALDKSLRKAGEGIHRLEVNMQDDVQFVYTSTGEACTVQEALFHFFTVPIDVIAEPREWYWYHRKPEIVEVSEDHTQVLVRFRSMSMAGESFGGTCLYAIQNKRWHAFRIRPNQSRDIATAIAWLEKRGWQDWS